MKQSFFFIVLSCSLFSSKGQISSQSFMPKVDIITGSITLPVPYDIASADLDGDGKTDVIVTNNNEDSICAFRNTSSATAVLFAARLGFSTGSGPTTIRTGDIDGDGKADVVVGHYVSGYISVFRNTSTTGTISFATRQDISVHAQPRLEAVADFTGDSLADLVVTSYADHTVTVLKNTSTPGNISFSTTMDISFSGTTPAQAIAMDFDGDGKKDLAVSNYANPSSVHIYRNRTASGSIAFDSAMILSAGVLSHGIAAADIDQDGKPDLVAADYVSGRILACKNQSSPGTLVFLQAVGYAAKSINGPNAVQLQDLNNDNIPEMVVTNDGRSDISVYNNAGLVNVIDSTSFHSKVEFGTGTNPYYMTFADINGDHKTDIIVNNHGTNTFSVLLSTIQQTGMMEAHDNRIAIELFPNPSAGDITITIRSSSSEDARISIYDLVGRVRNISAVPLHAGKNRIDLTEVCSQLEAGQYFLHVKAGDGTITRKLVIGR